MTINYLLILGIGHLIGDFYLPSEKIAKYKDERYKSVLVHSLEYYFAFLLIILPIVSQDMILAATYAALAHFVIDTIKFVFLRKKKIKKSDRGFLLDQCVHVISLFVLAYIMDRKDFSIGHIEIVENIISEFCCDVDTMVRWVLAILLIHRPTNIFIQNFLGEYKPKEEGAIIKADHKVGRRIGTMERFIMLIFLSMNQYAAIGFILTAKSIARYDKIAKDEKFAEYYLLGTLVSTLCVIICRVLILV